MVIKEAKKAGDRKQKQNRLQTKHKNKKHKKQIQISYNCRIMHLNILSATFYNYRGRSWWKSSKITHQS
jgi:hypothetical protein